MAVFALAACEDAAPRAALATFERFQDALFAADAAAVRGLVTAESAPAVDAIPWRQVQARKRLIAVDAIDCRGCFHLEVRDPNCDDAPGTYVVVRENGRLVVDLLATAELCATPTSSAAAPMLEPRALTPADLDEIHRRELATPRGEQIR